MDLKRKLGLGSDSRQSYELIRSTQSLVDRLNLDTEDITIQPVHPSIMGQVGMLDGYQQGYVWRGKRLLRLSFICLVA